MSKNPKTHTCPDCYYTWDHGQHGGHSCVARLRQQLDESSKAVPVVPFGQGKNITVNSRYHLPTDDTAASLTISENGKSAVTLTFANQNHASDVLKALVAQRYGRPAVPTIHIGTGYESVMTLPGSMINPQGEEVTTLTISQGETNVRLTFPTDRRATDFLRLLISDPKPAAALAEAVSQLGFTLKHPDGEQRKVWIPREIIKEFMGDKIYEELGKQFCRCEPIGETNYAECNCAERAGEFEIIDALDGATDEYYLQDSSTYAGNEMLWWRQNGNGYTTDLRQAHVFTKAKAFGQHKSRETDIPWPKAYIDQQTRPTVDMQRINRVDALASMGEAE